MFSTKAFRPLSKVIRPGNTIRDLPNSTSRFAQRQQRSQLSTKPPPNPARRFVSGTLLLISGTAFLAYYYDSRSMIHEHIAMPFLRRLDAEKGHQLAIQLLKNKWIRPTDKKIDGDELQAELFGLPLSNPVGMAAGFDKDGEAIDGLFDLGFGYVEIGSVTPKSQPGNPKPRFFRLLEDEAAINRYGFNSLGHAQMLSQLQARLLSFSRTHPSLFPPPVRNSRPLPPSGLPRSLRPGHLLAVNLGKNKTSAADSNEDYISGVKLLGPYADIVVINVSSPNTPGLRALQGREILEKLLKDVVEERDRIKVDGLPKIAVKVACDLSEEELSDVAAAVRGSGVEGVIVSNTTIKRKELGLKSELASQVGGLSGKPLFPLALQAVKTIRPLLPPSIPVIGCGGISTSQDAITMARSGASIIQVYTSFGYRGIGLPALLKDEISADLAQSGQTWRSEIGKDWGGKNMGWDENRLKKESEALREEAKSLGELVRKRIQDDDLSQLIKEAEKALEGFTGGKSDIGGQSRDNLAGGGGGELKQGDDSKGGSSSKSSERSQSPQSPKSDDQSKAAGSAQASKPLGGPLGPIIVKQAEGESKDLPKKEVPDAWAGAVKTGNKRFV